MLPEYNNNPWEKPRGGRAHPLVALILTPLFMLLLLFSWSLFMFGSVRLFIQTLHPSLAGTRYDSPVELALVEGNEIVYPGRAEIYHENIAMIGACESAPVTVALVGYTRYKKPELILLFARKSFGKYILGHPQTGPTGADSLLSVQTQVLRDGKEAHFAFVGNIADPAVKTVQILWDEEQASIPVVENGRFRTALWCELRPTDAQIWPDGVVAVDENGVEISRFVLQP